MNRLILWIGFYCGLVDIEDRSTLCIGQYCELVDIVDMWIG